MSNTKTLKNILIATTMLSTISILASNAEASATISHDHTPAVSNKISEQTKDNEYPAYEEEDNDTGGS